MVVPSANVNQATKVIQLRVVPQTVPLTHVMAAVPILTVSANMVVSKNVSARPDLKETQKPDVLPRTPVPNALPTPSVSRITVAKSVSAKMVLPAMATNYASTAAHVQNASKTLTASKEDMVEKLANVKLATGAMQRFSVPK